MINDGKEAGISQEEVENRIAATKTTDVCSIVYTSGTTGRPKGCRLLHSNWLGEARAILTHPVGQCGHPGYRVLTFLPLAHVFARAISLACVVGGATQIHWSDMGSLVTQFERSKPNLIVAVPRIFEKVHAGAKAKAVDGGGLKAKIFLQAEKVAVEYSRALDNPEAKCCTEGATRGVRQTGLQQGARGHGGKLEYAISGGSACNPELLHFFRGIGVRIFEGYGLTESTAAIAVSFDPDNIIGTVGRPMGGNTIRIDDDGEITIKGTVVFDGYWRNEEATKESFTEDGFYRTGDLGRLLPSGHLKITGRKKEIIVTAGGKNVSPANGGYSAFCTIDLSSNGGW